MAAPTYQLDMGRQQLLTTSEYTANLTFSATHEWVTDGSADILVTAAAANLTNPTLTPQHAKITLVGRALGGPQLLKVKDVSNYNDQFMTMSASKWVIHLGRPTRTIHENDWELSLNNLCALEECVAMSRGINMLIYTPNDVPKDLRATAPCFLPNDIEGDDKALLAYKSKLGPRFRTEYEELSPWWKLNELNVIILKGKKLPAGVPQEKSIERSLVALTFTIMYNYISSTKINSFSAIISKVRVLVSGMHYNSHVQGMTVTMAPPAITAPPTVSTTIVPQTSAVPLLSIVTAMTTTNLTTLIPLTNMMTNGEMNGDGDSQNVLPDTDGSLVVIDTTSPNTTDEAVTSKANGEIQHGLSDVNGKVKQDLDPKTSSGRDNIEKTVIAKASGNSSKPNNADEKQEGAIIKARPIDDTSEPNSAGRRQENGIIGAKPIISNEENVVSGSSAAPRAGKATGDKKAPKTTK